MPPHEANIDGSIFGDFGDTVTPDRTCYVITADSKVGYRHTGLSRFITVLRKFLLHTVLPLLLLLPLLLVSLGGLGAELLNQQQS